MSLSARRAWIEIADWKKFWQKFKVALRKESVDRNMWWGVRKAVGSLSLSARRAWIEINMSCNAAKLWVVALRKESVDRNTHSQGGILRRALSLSARRAWIEILRRELLQRLFPSLSARRAWIEILRRELLQRLFPVALRKESVDRNIWSHTAPYLDNNVALRKESVDRNAHRLFFVLPRMKSLSARRAWIEMPTLC